jgi:anti-sigma regulatory factor (Ser/Thr protein kinase)
VEVDLVPLSADGRAAGEARRVVRRQLQSWELDDLLDTAMLLTSEVVTNVIVHTASAPTLGLARDGAGLRVTVVDGSPVPPRRRWHSATATTGRGLQMLQELADEWGWDPVGDGKAVWFRLGGTTGPAADGSARAHQDRVAPAAATPSPLGRYGPAPDAGPAADTAGLVTVELLGVPVRVLAASREHHDSLMREFRLLALAGPAGPDVPARLVELTQTLGVRFAAAGSRPDEDFERAMEQGLETTDLVYRVPAAAAEGARQLAALMSEADEFCRSAQLITPPRGPVIVRFGQWYLRQFLDQIAGLPPTRWDGPLEPG